MPRRMGGSSRDSYTNVDTTVGTIVWVRRRNGSWWPGKIISDAELSSANLLSPRSGTPVKLLGREDGSVDWYNIEKSKRVKPFRCGDFEECIEKAKAVAGLPTKKREKYARREDAILHALELEKQQLESSNEFIASSAYKRDPGELPDRVVAHQQRGSNRRKRKPKPVVSPESSDSGNSQVYPEEDSAGVSSSGKGQELELELEGEWNPGDDEVEGLPRMRGLQDLGLRSSGARRILMNNEENLEVHQSCITQGGKSPGVLNGCSVPHFTTKRKRTPSSDEGLIRRRDRRRALIQVLENNNMNNTGGKFSSEDDAELMQIVEEDDDALVEGSQALGGMERMGVEFASCSAPENTGVLDGSSIDHGTTPESRGEEICLNGGLQGVSSATAAEPGGGIEETFQKPADEGMYASILSEWPSPADAGVAADAAEGETRDAADAGKGEMLLEGWIEVPVTRENNGQRETVPMVLLASRLTKRPVVGYPVVVEPADEEETGDESDSQEMLTGWRNPRRTRDEEEVVLKRRPGRPLGSLGKKNSRKQHFKENLSKKLLKKVVQSSRKTRTLSSIDYDNQRGFSGLLENHPEGLEIRVGAARAEVNGGYGCWPVATCVPVRVALSRIKAAVTASSER